MLTFMKYLKEDQIYPPEILASMPEDLRELIEKSNHDSRLFQHFVLKNGYRLSIQGSSFNYSHPRETLSPELYEAMEVAVLYRENGNFGAVASLTEDPHLIKDFQSYYSSGVYPYVPVELIERLFQAIKKDIVTPKLDIEDKPAPPKPTTKTIRTRTERTTIEIQLKPNKE